MKRRKKKVVRPVARGPRSLLSAGVVALAMGCGNNGTIGDANVGDMPPVDQRAADDPFGNLKAPDQAMPDMTMPDLTEPIDVRIADDPFGNLKAPDLAVDLSATPPVDGGAED